MIAPLLKDLGSSSIGSISRWSRSDVHLTRVEALNLLIVFALETNVQDATFLSCQGRLDPANSNKKIAVDHDVSTIIVLLV